MKEKKYSYGIYNLPPIPTSPPISGWHQFQSHPTGGGKKEDPSGGAIQLQGHGNPVFYQNVWIVTK
jgi:hypothetical protein